MMKAKKNFKTKMFITSALIIALSAAVHANPFNNSFSEKDTTSVTSSRIQALNMCPGGIALGIFSANYERLLKPNHGIVFRADYELVPKTYSDAKIDANGKAFIVNYRYHFSGEMNSLFVGAFSRYRIYKGEGSLESIPFDFSIPEVTIGANAGKRWVWNNGFTMTFALGYGHFMGKTKVDESSPDIDHAIDTFKKEYDFLNGFLGEFSIGYAF